MQQHSSHNKEDTSFSTTTTKISDHSWFSGRVGTVQTVIPRDKTVRVTHSLRQKWPVM